MAIIEFPGSKKLEVHLTTPVVVSGYKESGIPFEERTYTVNVGADGGLIELVTPVQNEQLLLLRNVKTEKEVLCCVASRRNGAKGWARVQVEFASPSPRFWELAFPAVDWNSTNRKRPTLARQ